MISSPITRKCLPEQTIRFKHNFGRQVKMLIILLFFCFFEFLHFQFLFSSSKFLEEMWTVLQGVTKLSSQQLVGLPVGAWGSAVAFEHGGRGPPSDGALLHSDIMSAWGYSQPWWSHWWLSWACLFPSLLLRHSLGWHSQMQHPLFIQIWNVY